jgi:hypothetical protein
MYRWPASERSSMMSDVTELAGTDETGIWQY